MFNKPNLLITGATGLIGSHLMVSLTERYKITAYTRNVAAAESALGSHIHYISDLATLSDLNSFEVVINLAGEPIVDKRWTPEQKDVIQQSRWQTTATLVQLIEASDNPPNLLISGSAIGYYGRQGETAISEDFEEVHDEFSHHLCKRWEDIALSAQSAKTRVCILRTGVVLSRHGGALDKMLTPFKLGLGGPIANGAQYLSWIHIKDMQDGIIFLLDNKQTQGIYNFTAPNPVTSAQFAKTLGSVLKRPTPFSTPEFVLRMLMGEAADLLVYGQNVVPNRLLEAGFTFNYTKLDKALQSFNLR